MPLRWQKSLDLAEFFLRSRGKTSTTAADNKTKILRGIRIVIDGENQL
jgi:hypothetical protein